MSQIMLAIDHFKSAVCQTRRGSRALGSSAVVKWNPPSGERAVASSDRKDAFASPYFASEIPEQGENAR